MQPIQKGVLFPVLLLGTSLLAQGEVDPRSAARKGGSVWLVCETTTDVRLELQDREITTSQKTTRTLHVQVKDVDAAGNLVVETTIARVHGRLVMAMDQGEFDFDSAAASTAEEGGGGGFRAQTMQQKVTAGAGMKFLCKVDPAGKGIELGEGASAIVDANKEGQGNLHQLTSQSLKQLVADAFGMLPEKRTAGGARWTLERLEFHGRAPTKQKLEVTLATVAPEAFEIEASGTVELAIDVLRNDKELASGDEAEVERQLDSTKLENGKITCKQKTSREDGFVLQASSQIVLDLVTSQSQMGEVTTHMKIDSSITRTTAEQALPKPAAPAKDAGKPAAGK